MLKEIQMFGCMQDAVAKGFREAFAGMRAMMAMSILSDAQEVLAMGDTESCRQMINKAKFGIAEYWMSLEREGASVPPPARVAHSAAEWELYASKEGVQAAAEYLNLAVNRAIQETYLALASGLPVEQGKATFIAKALPAFHEKDDFGARDTEPLWHLDHIGHRLFGRMT